MKLEHKTALITGGNSGIGLATARVFVAEGAQVVITGRDQRTLDNAAAELGPRALAVTANVTDAQSVEKAVAMAVATFGRLDVVFANAGIAATTPIIGGSVDTFDEVLRTNLTGVFVTVQAAVPYLNDGASIVLTGSSHSVLGAPGWAAYAASKAGVRAMVRVFASELSPRGIRVNVVAPGATRTPIWSRSSVGPAPDALAAAEARVARSVPLGRMSEAEEIAKAVLFLASGDAANIQGIEIAVDGGVTSSPAGAPVYRA